MNTIVKSEKIELLRINCQETIEFLEEMGIETIGELIDFSTNPPFVIETKIEREILAALENAGFSVTQEVKKTTLEDEFNPEDMKQITKRDFTERAIPPVPVSAETHRW